VRTPFPAVAPRRYNALTDAGDVDPVTRMVRDSGVPVTLRPHR
jgi:hypothetical protein